MLQLLMSVGAEAATALGGPGEAGWTGKAKGPVFGPFLAAAEGRTIEVATADATPPEMASLAAPAADQGRGEGQPDEVWLGAMVSMASQPAAAVPAEGGPSEAGDDTAEGGDPGPVSEVSPVGGEPSARRETTGAHRPDVAPGSTAGRELRNGAGVSVVPKGWSGEGVARAMAHASENARFVRVQGAVRDPSTQPADGTPEDDVPPAAVESQASSPTVDGEADGPASAATATGEGVGRGAAGPPKGGGEMGQAWRSPEPRTAEGAVVIDGRPSGEPRKQQDMPTVGAEGRQDGVAHGERGIPVVGVEGRPSGEPGRQDGIAVVGRESRPDGVEQRLQGFPMVGMEGRPDRLGHGERGIPPVGAEGPPDGAAQGRRDVAQGDALHLAQPRVDGAPAEGPGSRGPTVQGRVASEWGRPPASAAGQVDAGASVEARYVSRERWAEARPGEIVGQLLVHTARLSTVHGSRLRVHLEPPHLGALELKLTLKEGVLTLEIQTELARTRDLIEMALPQLRLALGERGIDLGKLSLGLAPASAGDGSSAQAPGSSGAFVLDAQGGGGGRQPTPEQSPVGGREQKSADSPGRPADGEQADRHLVDYRI